MKSKKLLARIKVKKRIRKKIMGTAEKPRLSVFKSNKQMYAQLIDDLSGHTLCASSSRDKTIAGKGDITKTEQARMVGALLAEKAKEVGVEQIVFDRSGYIYHGRVKTLAEAARKGGLKF